jgi:hypothetical protein
MGTARSRRLQPADTRAERASIGLDGGDRQANFSHAQPFAVGVRGGTPGPQAYGGAKMLAPAREVKESDPPRDPPVAIQILWTETGRTAPVPSMGRAPSQPGLSFGSAAPRLEFRVGQAAVSRRRAMSRPRPGHPSGAPLGQANDALPRAGADPIHTPPHPHVEPASARPGGPGRRRPDHPLRKVGRAQDSV